MIFSLAHPTWAIANPRLASRRQRAGCTAQLPTSSRPLSRSRHPSASYLCTRPRPLGSALSPNGLASTCSVLRAPSCISVAAAGFPLACAPTASFFASSSMARSPWLFLGGELSRFLSLSAGCSRARRKEERRKAVVVAAAAKAATKRARLSLAREERERERESRLPLPYAPPRSASNSRADAVRPVALLEAQALGSALAASLLVDVSGRGCAGSSRLIGWTRTRVRSPTTWATGPGGPAASHGAGQSRRPGPAAASDIAITTRV